MEPLADLTASPGRVHPHTELLPSASHSELMVGAQCEGGRGLTLSSYHQHHTLSWETRTRGAVSPGPRAAGRPGWARSQGRLEGEAGGFIRVGMASALDGSGSALGHCCFRPLPPTLRSGWWARSTQPCQLAWLGSRSWKVLPSEEMRPPSRPRTGPMTCSEQTPRSLLGRNK